MASRPRVRPPRRTTTLLVLLALGATLLGAPLHLLFVRHAVCAEHGELLHVRGDLAEAAAHCGPHRAPAGPLSPADAIRTAAADTARAPRTLASSLPGGEGGHEVCELTFPRFEAFVLSRAPAGHVPAPRNAQAPPGDQTLEPRSFPLFRLAPKQSPPV